jgi:hypothetical protein
MLCCLPGMSGRLCWLQDIKQEGERALMQYAEGGGAMALYYHHGRSVSRTNDISSLVPFLILHAKKFKDTSP